MTEPRAAHLGDSSHSWEGLIEDIHDFLAVVADVTGAFESGEPMTVKFPELDEALEAVERVLRVRGRTLKPYAGVAGPRAVALLLTETADLRHRLMVLTMTTRHRMMHRVNSALQRLRQCESESEFVRQVPIEVVSLGYQRALFSRMDSELHWVTETAHSINGQRESDLLVEAGRQWPLRDIRDYFEYDMIRNRRPIFESGIRRSTRVHPELLEVTGAEAFAAAPVMTGGKVMGFTNIDVSSTGTVDAFDRDLLGTFSAGAGLVLDRIRLGPSVASPGPGLADLGQTAASESPALATLSRLTAREGEVLALISDGCTNADIGRELFISEGTAKTHVRNVLHKLGATNRTMAASIHRRVRG